MKDIFALGCFLFSYSALAGPISLLECEMSAAPIQSAAVYSYNGRLLLMTRPAEGDWRSQPVTDEELEKKQILLIDAPELKGVLYFRDDRWLYTFKGPNGWRMSGRAYCYGPNAIWRD